LRSLAFSCGPAQARQCSASGTRISADAAAPHARPRIGADRSVEFDPPCAGVLRTDGRCLRRGASHDLGSCAVMDASRAVIPIISPRTSERRAGCARSGPRKSAAVRAAQPRP